jgi:protein subunit release factor B
MSEKKKVLLFSVTADDCDWQTTRGSGPGGQHRNTTNTAVRCTHRDSGAVGYAEDNKSQRRNKESAFERMCKTPKFQSWHKLETARRILNEQSIEAMIAKRVDEAMRPSNIKTEVRDKNGRWIESNDDLHRSSEAI